MNDETNRERPDEPEPTRPQQAGADELARGLERLERALRAGPPAPRDHGPVRAAMPAMAAAELRGERIADLFPAEVGHLDACAACSLEYGALVDALLELDAASVGGEAAALPAPHMPARLLAGLRLRGWVIGAAQAVLAGAQHSAEGVEQAVDALVERLGAALGPGIGGAAAAPVPLAFDADDAESALIAATWRAAELLAGQASAAELAALAARGELARQARAAAEEAAHAVDLPRRARARFVAEFVRRVEADPAAVVALGDQTA